MRSLLESVPARPGLEPLKHRPARIAQDIRDAVGGDEPEAAALLDGLERALDPRTMLFCDMCIAGYWVAGYRRFQLPRTLAYPVGWGTLGFGFPAAIGAALARQTSVVAVCGDGGFLFACGDLATVAHHQVPLTVVLVNDAGYGQLRFDQERDGQEPFGVDLLTPDFEQLAGAFGIPALRVSGFGEDFVESLRAGVGGGCANMIVVDSALKQPPRTTSPRWYRRRDA